MLIRKTLLAGAVAAALASFTIPAFAEVGVYIDLAPPPPRVEHFDPRPGYVVAPGYWDYNNGKHDWVNGHYIAEKKGYHYEGDRWVQHDNNKWTRQQGGWRENDK
jgi:WXXGXW repeat (2 copies)